MADTTLTSVIVRIGPTTTQSQADIIPPATPQNAGVMTALQAAQLAALVAAGNTGSGLTPNPAAPALAFQTSQNAAVGQLMRMDPTPGALSVFLPPAAAKAGPIGVKVESASNNGVTVMPNGLDTIDGLGGGTAPLLSQDSITLYSDGISNWMVQR